MYRSKVSVNECWAIVDENGRVCYSRGGSSSSSKLMVYESEARAKRVLCSPWIKNMEGLEKASVKLIYNNAF
jgi:hypothetical protein